MLLISRRHKFIFLHVPKTAGTAISRALSQISELPLWESEMHSTLDGCRRYLRDHEIARFKKFIVVRNTWDRVASAYWHLLRDPMTDTTAYVHIKQAAFRDYISSYAKPKLMSQTRWLYFKNQQRRDVNVIRFEQLERGFEEICDYLGLTAALERENDTPGRPDYRRVYDRETAALVEKIFADEISLFGFECPPLRSTEDVLHDIDILGLRDKLTKESDRILQSVLSGPATAVEFCRSADLDVQAGRLNSAADKYLQAVRLEPDNPWHNYAAAFTFRLLGDLDRATRFIETATTMNDAFGEAWNEASIIYLQADQNRESEICWETRDIYRPCEFSLPSLSKRCLAGGEGVPRRNRTLA